MKRKNNIYDVAIVADTATGWGRSLVRGIIKYSCDCGPWQLAVRSQGPETPAHLPHGWRGNGIIARVGSYATSQHVAAAGVPVVNISAIELKGVNFPRVAVDVLVGARIAADYLLDRGYRHFGYCGLKHRPYVDKHYRAIAEAVSHVSKEVPFFGTTSEFGVKTANAWHTQQEKLARWLKTLPQPAAVVTWTPELGREAIYACHHAGILVPEQIAILASDNDELLCEACVPSLSGMALAAERQGYVAASLLDQLMRGVNPPAQPILIEPSGVVTRQSTDTLAIADSDVADAVAFIRSRCTQTIQVKDVLRSVGLSRRDLEKRFRRILGRTPAAEIRRVHLERAKELLAGSTLSIPKVAIASGFGSHEYMIRVFKQATGLTPHQYRSHIDSH